MKQYRLLKDLPGLKKGTILSEGKPIFDTRTLITKNDVGHIFISNNLSEELFEEIQEEPTDSIHWEPLPGDIYWYLSNTGVVLKKQWMSSPDDIMRHVIGNTYRTEKECDKAYSRKFAKARLRRTSTFEPDFENCEGGWVVGYDYDDNSLIAIPVDNADYGEIVRYATEEDALKSIKENGADWLKYLGIKEEE